MQLAGYCRTASGGGGDQGGDFDVYRGDVTLTECTDMCMQNASCLAFEYDSNDACEIHTGPITTSTGRSGGRCFVKARVRLGLTSAPTTAPPRAPTPPPRASMPAPTARVSPPVDNDAPAKEPTTAPALMPTASPSIAYPTLHQQSAPSEGEDGNTSSGWIIILVPLAIVLLAGLARFFHQRSKRDRQQVEASAGIQFNPAWQGAVSMPDYSVQDGSHQVHTAANAASPMRQGRVSRCPVALLPPPLPTVAAPSLSPSAQPPRLPTLAAPPLIPPARVATASGTDDRPGHGEGRPMPQYAIALSADRVTSASSSLHLSYASVPDSEPQYAIAPDRSGPPSSSTYATPGSLYSIPLRAGRVTSAFSSSQLRHASPPDKSDPQSRPMYAAPHDDDGDDGDDCDSSQDERVTTQRHTVWHPSHAADKPSYVMLDRSAPHAARAAYKTLDADGLYETFENPAADKPSYAVLDRSAPHAARAAYKTLDADGLYETFAPKNPAADEPSYAVLDRRAPHSSTTTEYDHPHSAGGVAADDQTHVAAIDGSGFSRLRRKNSFC